MTEANISMEAKQRLNSIKNIEARCIELDKKIDLLEKLLLGIRKTKHVKISIAVVNGVFDAEQFDMEPALTDTVLRQIQNSYIVELVENTKQLEQLLC